MIRARTSTTRQQRAHSSRAVSNGDDYAADDPKNKKKRRRRKIPEISPFKICAGTFFSIALLVFMAVLDFQPPDKVKREPLIHKVLTRSETTHEWPSPTRNGSICWFDGHCPERTICSPNEDGFGTCTSYALEESPQLAVESCVDTCTAELQMDEHFHHGTWPNVEAGYTFDSDSYPSGCRVVFSREPQGAHFDSLKELDDTKAASQRELAPSVQHWVDARFRHVKRVDPLNNFQNDSRWTALCTHSCTSDSDCFTRMSKTAFVCLEGSCQRNQEYWPVQNMTIVTGATGSFLVGLRNLVASAKYWAPSSKVVVYNLGKISPAAKIEIQSWTNVESLEWADGVPSHYPSHVKKSHKYAWKPIILNETVHKYGSIFWLDAGSTLVGPIDPARKITQKQGVMLVKGQDQNMKLSHEGTYQWFGFDKETMQTGPHFSGNTQAYMYPSRYVDSVVIPNAECALDKECISPAGSYLQNHRFDQTSLSILAYQPKVMLGHHTEYLASSAAQLNPDLTQPSFKFVWTARQTCFFYADKLGLSGTSGIGGNTIMRLRGLQRERLQFREDHKHYLLEHRDI
jgi:hypothetical protein